jgi:16S rRNA (guanine966-N2)-methyltransferase
MRIIAGKHKNRVIPTRKESDYRPSTEKFREALFSILSSGEFADTKPVVGAQVLDLFAGTGSLSFESLSRGANNVTLVDNDRENMDLALNFAKKIGEEKNTSVLIADATFLSKSSRKYNLVFMDPPYFKNLIIKSLTCLIKNDWLENGAIITVEMSYRENIEFIDSITLVKEKIYGNNKLLILKYEQK